VSDGSTSGGFIPNFILINVNTFAIFFKDFYWSSELKFNFSSSSANSDSS